MSPRTVVIGVVVLAACALLAAGMLATLSLGSADALLQDPRGSFPAAAAAPASGASCEATAAGRQVALPRPATPGRALQC